MTRTTRSNDENYQIVSYLESNKLEPSTSINQPSKRNTLQRALKLNQAPTGNIVTLRPLCWQTVQRQMAFLLSSFVVLLMIGASCDMVVKAEHALSEVWSEADGLQMKYSTDHDDMLSTKGSELSLSAHQPSNKQEVTSSLDGPAGHQVETEKQQTENSEPAPGGSSEESSAGGDDNTSISKSNGDSATNTEEQIESNDEQGADASKRADSRVVPPISISQSGHSGKQSRFSETASRFSGSTEESQPSSASALSSGAEDNDSSGRLSKNFESNAGSFEAAADEAGREEDLSAENVENGSRNLKFHQPGRLFREAIKMNTRNEASQTKQSEKGESPDEADSAKPEESPENGREKVETEQGGDAGEEPNASGEPDFGPPASGDRPLKSEAQSQRQNMIDFDRIVDRQREVKFKSPSSVGDLVNVDGGSDEDDEEDRESRPGRANDGFKKLGHRRLPVMRSALRNEFAQSDNEDTAGQDESAAPRQGSFHDHRHMTAGSTAHKERLVPTSSSKSPVSGSKQLAYFRGVSQQANNEQTIRRPAESPDNVRDNFISPGHYPGSMPHLTQAASELLKRELSMTAGEAISPPIVSVVPIDQKAIDQVTTASTISAPSSMIDQKATSDTIVPKHSGESVKQPTEGAGDNSAPTSTANLLTDNRAAGNSLGNRADRGTSRPELREFDLQVTPEPESQPESQQIMAPILLSTTTMAPMPSTSQPPPPTTTTTAETPSLKRFKFRKYR